MTTKQRSKPLESPVHIIKNKNRQKRSPIEKKLLECYKSHQPVLLYNDTSNKHSNIILDIHLENGGSLYDVKYGGNKEKRVFLRDIADERNEKESGIKRTIKDYIGTFERFQLDETQREIHNKVKKNFKGKKKAYSLDYS